MPGQSTGQSALSPAEVRRQLARLGFTLAQAAAALGISTEHMRAMADGRSRVTLETADRLRSMSLTAAAELRLRLWHEHEGHPPLTRTGKHAIPAPGRRRGPTRYKED